MLHRPLALVSVLCAADYLLWNWSLGGSHDVLALISGLTLPPLTVALLWLLALNLARLLARTARRPRATSVRSGSEPTDLTGRSWEDEPVSGSDSSKLAA